MCNPRYNTMRELSDRCTEYWPMLAFNETLVPGPGKGGADWLQEHIRTGYLYDHHPLTNF